MSINKHSLAKFWSLFSFNGGVTQNSVSTPTDPEVVKEKIKESVEKSKGVFYVDLDVSLCKELSTEERDMFVATAKNDFFEVVGVGKSPLHAKRNLLGNLKRMNKFSRIAMVMVGQRTGAFKCNATQNDFDLQDYMTLEKPENNE